MNVPSLAWSIPFACLLGAIALMPFIHRHWWEKHYPKVALALAAVPLVYYLGIAHDASHWLAAMSDYVSFIILLGSLYVVSGGIHIDDRRRATPLANCVLLLIGALLANVLGTTGASMLLIRPYLRMNRARLRPFHVVFFIFIIANAGGALTPIGDPPLFLGYLRGVPFWWVAEHCWKAWAFVVGSLVAVFFVMDTLAHRRQPSVRRDDAGPVIQVTGIHNLLFIALILLGVFREGFFEVLALARMAGFSPMLVGRMVLSREMLMIYAAVLSRMRTSQAVYQQNEFTFGPIREVAILFVAIFSTMAPTLQWLEGNASHLPLRTPGQFYFATGTLSSVLDNAPTYLTFLETRLGTVDKDQVAAAKSELERMARTGSLEVDPQMQPGPVRAAAQEIARAQPQRVAAGTVNEDEIRLGFLLGNPELNIFVVAISLGAVFFGACTYIGNGPNFMVKSLAESSGGGVTMPHFIPYILYFALPILLPIYILVWVIFLR